VPVNHLGFNFVRISSWTGEHGVKFPYEKPFSAEFIPACDYEEV
jgi:hypothetical protein